MKPTIKQCPFILFTLFSLVICFSCGNSNEDEKYQPTDYSDESNWLYVEKNVSKPVDVFFAYPTTYSGNDTSCVVTDSGMREGAVAIRYRYATVYEESANLFMPFYRQVNAEKALTLSFVEKDKLMRDIPVTDIINAFEYYLDNYSNGRPFILAGHSQGSNTLLYVLEYMKDKPDLMDRLVCAYVIGYSVTSDFLSDNQHLKFAQGRTDTGVIVSWNTESPGVTATNPVIEPGAIAMNPIIWTTEETYAGQELSLGARVEEAQGVYTKIEHFADAQVDKHRGVIICSTVNMEDYKIPSPVFPLGVLHACDYPFYYYDLQQNVKDRVDEYLEY